MPVGNGPSGIAISPGAVWVTNRLDDTVTEIDSKTGKVRRHTSMPGASPSDIAYGLGALWIANESSSTVTRLDPRTGGLQEFTVGNGPEAVAVGYGSIWVANSLDGTVSRINPSSNVVTSRSRSERARRRCSRATARSGLPTATAAGSSASTLRPTHSSARSRVGSGPQSLASIGGRVWLSARETAAVHRGGTLRLFD